jgi:hypothetical protein
LEVTLREYCACNASSKDFAKQQHLIRSLELKISLQQREWEIQKQLITKQKDQAVQAAKYATKKLMDTVGDFEKQANTQKNLQGMLRQALHDKDVNLQNSMDKSKVQDDKPCDCPFYTETTYTVSKDSTNEPKKFNLVAEQVCLCPKQTKSKTTVDLDHYISEEEGEEEEIIRAEITRQKFVALKQLMADECKTNTSTDCDSATDLTDVRITFFQVKFYY